MRTFHPFWRTKLYSLLLILLEGQLKTLIVNTKFMSRNYFVHIEYYQLNSSIRVVTNVQCSCNQGKHNYKLLYWWKKKKKLNFLKIISTLSRICLLPANTLIYDPTWIKKIYNLTSSIKTFFFVSKTIKLCRMNFN